MGIKLGLKNYTERMSKKRILNNIWFIPFNSMTCSLILKKTDPLYHEIIGIIGEP